MLNAEILIVPFDGAESYGFTFPEKGTYFVYDTDQDIRPVKLQIPGYAGF